MSKMKKLLAVAMFAVATTIATGCGGNNTVQTVAVRDSILVDTVSPQMGSIIVMGEYIGTVEPNQQVAVLPRIPGEVLSVYFGVGDMVEAGDILFTIDTADVENNIAALEAQLAVQDATVRAAQTGVELVDGAAMESQLLQATGGIAQAEAAVSQAEQNVEQSRIGIEQAQMAYDMAAQAYADTAILFEAGVAARVAYDQAEAGYLNATAALERAQSGYAMATIALSQAQLGHAQAVEGQRILVENAPEENRRRATDALSQAQAARNTIIVNLDLARDRLDDATVRAPIGGVIERRNVEPFGFANPQAPAFVISDQDSMAVFFRVPRSSFEHLAIGDEITLFDGTAEYFGTITEIAATVDAGGLIGVNAAIPNPPANLLGGTSVRIFAEAARAVDVPVLPLGVIHYDRGVPYVYVEDGGFANRVQIETGIFDAHEIQVLYGVTAGDRIISTWSARLTDGAEVHFND